MNDQFIEIVHPWLYDDDGDGDFRVLNSGCESVVVKK